MGYEVLNGSTEPTLRVRAERLPWLNVVLFIATCFTTLLVGTVLMAAWEQDVSSVPGGTLEEISRNPLTLLRGLPFSVAILSILLAHEMGHYLTCRYYGISATLPYFIPFPSLIGTLGAFIRIRSPFLDRASLLEVGVAGPIAGFVVAIPVLAVALTQSRYGSIEPEAGLIVFGEPIAYRIISSLVGVTPPDGQDLFLHPVGLAAWFGFFLTALNLLPVGQLDGGHIAYALFGRFHKRISQILIFLLFPMGVFLWPGWFVWIFALALLGTRHPPTLDDALPLGKRQILLGWIAIGMLVVCFTPVPITIY